MGHSLANMPVTLDSNAFRVKKYQGRQMQGGLFTLRASTHKLHFSPVEKADVC